MLYSVLIYSEDGAFDRLPPERQDAYMQTHRDLQSTLSARGDFAVARLMPVSNAVTLRPGDGAKPLVVDGPFAETKERFAGFYVIESDSLDEAVDLVGELASPGHSIEVRPINWAGGVFAKE